MPFDPNWPSYKAKNDSAKWRVQLNSLNDKLDAQAATIAAQAVQIASMNTQIAAILLQLAALTPSLTATGFGEMGANGKITQIGMFNGKPMYQAAGGWYYCWNADGGMWICRDAMPGTGYMSNNRYADTGYASEITAAVWGPGFNPGMLPCGTVS